MGEPLPRVATAVLQYLHGTNQLLPSPRRLLDPLTRASGHPLPRCPAQEAPGRQVCSRSGLHQAGRAWGAVSR